MCDCSLSENEREKHDCYMIRFFFFLLSHVYCSKQDDSTQSYDNRNYYRFFGKDGGCLNTFWPF